MSFLSVAFLAALPLAAAPLLLHFFDRRRNVVIQWGAMQFLQAAATQRTSARRLKELLLLLLRIAALLALILALARPLIPGNLFGTTNRRETILVVDNSMSIMREADGRPLVRQLVERATKSINRLERGDWIRIMLASPYPVWLTAGSLRVDATSKAKLCKQLGELRPTEGSSDLLAALLTAVQSDAEATLQQRRIVLLTDGQRNDWKLEDVAGWRRFQAALAAAPVPTRLDIHELQNTTTGDNLAVNAIRASRTVVGVGQPFSLSAEIQNHSVDSSQAGQLRWTVDGRQRHQQTLAAISGGNSQGAVWKHAFDRTGVFSVSCEIDSGDELAPDNRATVVIEVVDRIPIVLVEGAAELADVQQDAFFIQAALGRMEGELGGEAWQAVFEPFTVAPARLETLDLEPFRAVVVPNLTVLSQRAVQALHEFVSAGGGLWLALGPRTDVDAFNHYCFNDGDGLSPLGLAGAVQETGGENSNTKLNPFGKDHPAVVELADVERLDTGDVKVSGRYRFHAGISYDNVSVLLDLTNGEPLAVEKYVGRGRVIVQGIPLRYQWSNLVLSQSFVVMVHDWLAYLTQPRATRYNLAPGDPISLHLTDSQFTEATLTTPHGDEIDLASEPAGGGVLFRSSRTLLPGEYALELGLSGVRLPFYVARDPLESQLGSLAAADRRQLTDLTGLGQSLASRQLSGTNQRDPIWPLLLIALIALIAGELWLSGLIAKQRFGSDAITETTEDWLQQASSMAAPPAAAAQPPPPSQSTTPDETSRNSNRVQQEMNV